MALVDVIMPQLGESIAEGTISKWHKKVGDKVAMDETLLEITTDKVDSEIPSPAAGIIAEILFQESATVPVQTIIARINSDVNASVAPSTAAPAPKPEASAPKAHQTSVENMKPETAPPKTKASEPTNGSTTGGSLVEVIMPQMGESIAEGTITKWHKKVGDKIGKDETLLEISTDKVDSEIPSPASGIVAEILFPEQTTVGVNTVIAKIATGSGVVVSSPVSKPVDEKKSAIAIPKSAITGSIPQSVIKEQPVSDRFYSPLVLNIARTENISLTELERLSGTGANGRVSKKDILGYVEQKKAGKVTEPTKSSNWYVNNKPVVTYSAGKDEVVKMDTMRRAIAEHMIRSKHTSAHVGSVTEADLTSIVKYREKHKVSFEQKEGFKLTYTPFFLDAVVKALKDYPMLNASVDGDNIILRKDINIGVAVALENGLIVPVIKNAEQKSLVEIGRTVNDLAKRARTKKLMPDEVTGGTFTVTNPGSFGSLYGFPIINQPQVAILGVGAIKKRPVVIDDAIAIRSMVYISMSYDHRIIDGALGGMFMERVVFYLENFDVNMAI